MRRGAAAIGVAVALGLGGCGTPFGPCYSEAVLVNLVGTIDGAQVRGDGLVAPGNVASYPELRRILVEGERLPGQSVIWTLDQFAGGGYLTIQLPAVFDVNQTFALNQVFVGGGWGVSNGSIVSTSALFGSVQATGVSGTIRVVATTPLKLEIDATYALGPAVSRRLQGTATFSFRRERTACT